MAKMSELDAALSALTEHCEWVIVAVRDIRRLLSDEPETPDTAEPEQPEAPQEPEKVYTLQDVRVLLKAKTDKGYRSEVKALLRAHGAERLPDIDPKEYPAMMKEAEEIDA